MGQHATKRKKREQIGALAFVIRTLLFGASESPQRPFLNGKELPYIPKSAEDLKFGLSELAEGCRVGTYQRVSDAHAEAQVDKGALISNAFVTWQREKPGFIINLKEQSMHWDKKSMRMETMSSFGSCLCPGNRLLSFDCSSGYRHVTLHSAMWD